MSKNPVSKSKPVKRNEPMHNALKFFLAGCVAEIYLLVIRRFYVNDQHGAHSSEKRTSP